MPQLLLCSLCSLAFSRYLSSILMIIFVPLWILRLAHTRNEQGRHEDGRVNGEQGGVSGSRNRLGIQHAQGRLRATRGQSPGSSNTESRVRGGSGGALWRRAFLDRETRSTALSHPCAREELEQAVPPCPPFE
ncbi:hypothetical protein B0H16DRAFT_1473147 [Mycena metata]|uniref:Uncharacterized protein n=1 Tax=Mycena metata TaxID=1033252 RepID=A0AAD7MMD9_9AGAR|nr:hypothetical protein B0H16DRAFT_1473147 [Mycena metata]